MVSENEKLLVAAFVRFLREKAQGGHLTESQQESVEATQCLETAFDTTQYEARLPPSRTVVDLFIGALETPTSGSTRQQQQHQKSAEPSEYDKATAERLKNEGNELMKGDQFEEAISKYTAALKLSESAVFYCNRAAAYSKLNQQQKAIDDCKAALGIDPQYSKAYGRMGLAYSCLERYTEAKDCYEKAIQLDPENQSFQNNLDVAKAKLAEAGGGAHRPAAGEAPPLLGGMPDLSALLNNPAMMNMASQMLTDPNMQNMMSNLMAGTFNQPGGQQGMGALLEAGQRLASQMQQQNPDLVEQLRRQFQQGGPGGHDSRDPNSNGQNPPP